MKVYFVTDMEGISMATEWDQVRQGHEFYPRYRDIFNLELAAAVEGAIAAGAERIVILDGHGSRDYNVLWERLPEMVEIERPGDVKRLFPSLDESFHSLVLIGYHAMAGAPEAVLPHTQNRDWEEYRVNGTLLGEIGQMSLIAGHYGVPVGYISGDRAAVEEARVLHGDDLPATVVKWGHEGGKARSLHPAEAARRIRADIEKALKAPRRGIRFALPAPYELTQKWSTKERADEKAGTTTMTRIDERTFVKTVDSALEILDLS
ncbi:MAG: M55 family metallopeptidase [Paenibacillaceae bacterium]|nr:M55 family metallopeptidase [Paenibacillaceae bacterium]